MLDITVEIKDLLKKTKGLNFSVNLAGTFTSHNEFAITPKWQFAIIRGAEREIAYLKGKIYQDNKGRTRASFTVRPNSIFPFFFFVFPVFGILMLTTNISKSYDGEIMAAGIIFTLLIPFVMLALGNSAKQKLKDRFVKTFDLKTVS